MCFSTSIRPWVDKALFVIACVWTSRKYFDGSPALKLLKTSTSTEKTFRLVAQAQNHYLGFNSSTPSDTEKFSNNLGSLEKYSKAFRLWKTDPKVHGSFNTTRIFDFHPFHRTFNYSENILSVRSIPEKQINRSLPRTFTSVQLSLFTKRFRTFPYICFCGEPFDFLHVQLHSSHEIFVGAQIAFFLEFSQVQAGSCGVSVSIFDCEVMAMWITTFMTQTRNSRVECLWKSRTL